MHEIYDDRAPEARLALTPVRVLLVEPSARLRSNIVDLLAAEGYDVQACDSVEQVLGRALGHDAEVALVAWQNMQTLLAEEHRHDLWELTRRLRVILTVPRRWGRILEGTDLGVAELLATPFTADELLSGIRRSLLDSVSRSGLGAERRPAERTTLSS